MASTDDVALQTKRANMVRKVHVPTKMSRKKADELAKRDDTPLDVMVENMLFWRHKAQELELLVVEKLNMIHVTCEGLTDAEQREPETMQKLITILTEVRDCSDKYVHARDKAQSCAVEAAPYVHPRIAPVHLKGGSDAAAKLIQKQTSPQDAMSAYLDSLRIVDIEVDAPDASPAAEPVAS